MNKLMITTAAIGLLGGLTAPAFAQDMSPDTTGHTVAFSAADANADGGVNFQELQASSTSLTQAQFDDADTDNNMTLDQQEFITLMDSGAVEMSASGDAGMANGVTLKFSRADANGNDGVNLQEMRAMDSGFTEAQFDDADTDNNMTLDRQEFTTLIDSGVMEMSASGDAGMASGATLKFSRADADGNDGVNLQELRAMDSSFTQAQFDDADTDNNMALDRQEFTTLVDSGNL